MEYIGAASWVGIGFCFCIGFELAKLIFRFVAVRLYLLLRGAPPPPPRR